MATTIITKNSSTAASVPTAAQLVQGELAVNVADKRIFTEDNTGTVVELGTNPSSITVPAGSASAPTITTAGDTNTGIFFPAADTIAFAEGGAEAMRITSSGNVGIGTSSPASRLAITETSTTAGAADIVRINTASGGNFNISCSDLSASVPTWTVQTGSGETLAFSQSTTERMRISAAGNVGIGTDSILNARLNVVVDSVDLIGLQTYRASSGAASGYQALAMAMRDSASATVVYGSIVPNITTNTAGSYSGSVAIYTANAGTNAERLRVTADGYLRMASGSGGIQFNGDTAAANSLDDYEEGTFTPVIQGTTTAGTGTYTYQTGRYTKIGNRVSANLTIAWTAHTGTGNMRISSLPYGSPNVSNTASACSVVASSITSPASSVIVGQVNENSSLVILYSQVIATSALSFLALDTAGSITVSVVYEAA